MVFQDKALQTTNAALYRVPFSADKIHVRINYEIFHIHELIKVIKLNMLRCYILTSIGS